MGEEKKRIAVFGGSFDPPHNGHAGLAEQILLQDHADYILFVPAFNPPHKQQGNAASFEDRCAMTELMTRQICGKFPNSCSVSKIEEQFNDSPSYTYNTIKALETIYPSDSLLLLIGLDSLINLHTWYEAEKLAVECRILTYPRKGICADNNDILKELKKNWSESIATTLFQSILNMDFFDVSSTEVRLRLAEGKDISQLIDSGVCQYIKKKGLYKSD